jgi:hypothetical protein
MSAPTKGCPNSGVTGLITVRKTLGTNPATPNINDVVGPMNIPLQKAYNMGLIDATSGTINTLTRNFAPTGY